MAWLPTYVTSGLGVDFARAGIFSMFPWLASFVFLNVAGVTADRMIAAGRTVIFVRKLMQTIGFGGSVSETGTVARWTPDEALLAEAYDTPIGTLPGVAGVYITGLILEATGSWLLVFQLAAAVYFFGMVFFLLFARSERLFE